MDLLELFDFFREHLTRGPTFHKKKSFTTFLFT